MATKMATTFGDITDLQQPHHPQNIPRLVEKIKGLPLKANLKNARGRGVHQPLPFVPRWEHDFACSSES